MSLLKFFKPKEKPRESSVSVIIESESRKCQNKRKRSGETVSLSAAKKTKQCENDSNKDKKYESKRERKFIVGWLDNFNWLSYDEDRNLMFCKFCQKYPKLAETKFNHSCVFVTGSNNFRIEHIRAHEICDPHKKCASQFIRDQEHSPVLGLLNVDVNTPVKDSPIGKSLIKLGEKEHERLQFFFNCAYSIACHNKPFTDMHMLCSLLKKNGVQMGENYDNDHKAREFISAISETVQQDTIKEIQCSPFISVLSDGSTDVSYREQEIIYVRYLSDGEVKTQFSSLEELSSSDAKGVKEGIDNGLRRMDLEFSEITSVQNNKPTLVCANFDGASVMQGLKTGTMSLILKDAPWVLPMHCVAHKLELAALDSVKADSYLRRFEDVIKGIYKFYHFSPKRRREVKAVAEFLGSDLVHISGIKQVRWLASRTKALSALKQNFSAIVGHLRQVADRSSTEEASRAKGYLREMTSVKFVILLHAMVDIMDITSGLSQVFQRSCLLVSEVYQQVEIHLLKLEELKHESGTSLTEFTTCYNSESKIFGEVELKGGIPTPQFLSDIIDDLSHYIDKRFSNFNKEPMKCFSALSYKLIPHNRSELLKFENSEIKSLLEHFSPLFPHDTHKTVLNEYTELKVYMRDLSQTDHHSSAVYKTLLRKPNIPNIQKLLQIMLVISPTTAECERGFSQMNLIKTSLRNSLQQDSLRMLMVLKQHGPAF